MPAPDPVPGDARRQVGVVAQVAVGLMRAPELQQRVAEREVGHGVAGLQAAEPERKRLLAGLVGGRAEVVAVHRVLGAVERPGRQDDLVGGRLAQAELRNMESRAAPRSLMLLVVRVVGRVVEHLEPDRPTQVHEDPAVGRQHLPRITGLAVIDAPELQRDQPVQRGHDVEVEARDLLGRHAAGRERREPVQLVQGPTQLVEYRRRVAPQGVGTPHECVVQRTVVPAHGLTFPCLEPRPQLLAVGAVVQEDGAGVVQLVGQ